jgi:hypothetical protein
MPLAYMVASTVASQCEMKFTVTSLLHVENEDQFDYFNDLCLLTGSKYHNSVFPSLPEIQ